MYLLALICPPLAIFLCGKPFQAMLSVPLSIFYFPSALWALLVVSDSKANARNRALTANADRNTTRQVAALDRNAARQIAALERQTRELTRALEGQQRSPIVVHVQQAAPAQALPQASNPPLSGTPTPAPASLGPVTKPLPREPLITIEGIQAFCARVKDGAIQAKNHAMFAYQNLPEWAQPITWGLAAATPVVIIVMTFRLMN
jgi:hypothetical protein